MNEGPARPTNRYHFLTFRVKFTTSSVYQFSQTLERKFVYQFSQPLWIGSNHLINYLTSFDEEESRHARDFELLRSSLIRVHVDLQELGPRPVLIRQLLVDRGNLLARTAPAVGLLVIVTGCHTLVTHSTTRFPPSHHVAVKSMMVSLF